MLLSSYQQLGHPIAPAWVRLRAQEKYLARVWRRPLSQNLTLLSPFSEGRKYPLFINVSSRRYRDERARAVRKFNESLKALRDYHGLAIDKATVATYTMISAC